jgi:hypothetical protein
MVEQRTRSLGELAELPARQAPWFLTVLAHPPATRLGPGVKRARRKDRQLSDGIGSKPANSGAEVVGRHKGLKGEGKALSPRLTGAQAGA